MQNRNIKFKTFSLLSFTLWLLVFSFCFLASCSVVSPYLGFEREELLRSGELSATYEGTKLKKSITLDVLPMVQMSKHELLSQGDSVVASLGQSKKGYKTWFNMVAFDEYKLTAKRKYFFIVDERIGRSPTNPKRVLIKPKRGLSFDCQMVLDKEVLDRPYATENARQIMILRQVLNHLRKDIDELSEDIGELGQGSEKLGVCGMLIKQVFEAILLKLDRSPALTMKLGDSSGVGFDHISFDKGKVRMVVRNDIVTVRIRLGVLVLTFDDVEDVGKNVGRM